MTARDFRVVSKGLKGPKDLPYVVMKNNRGDKLEIRLDEESQLEQFEINEIWRVKVSQEQQKISEGL